MGEEKGGGVMAYLSKDAEHRMRVDIRRRNLDVGLTAKGQPRRRPLFTRKPTNVTDADMDRIAAEWLARVDGAAREREKVA